jgi:hypothetical protein
VHDHPSLVVRRYDVTAWGVGHNDQRGLARADDRTSGESRAFASDRLAVRKRAVRRTEIVQDQATAGLEGRCLSIVGAELPSNQARTGWRCCWGPADVPRQRVRAG